MYLTIEANKFGPHPMHAAQGQRRAEPAVARRRDVERHLGNGQRLKAMPQPFKLGMIDASPRASGIDQAIFRVVIGEQQRPEPGPGPFGIGPADHEAKP
jgi:hypothetical protein